MLSDITAIGMVPIVGNLSAYGSLGDHPRAQTHSNPGNRQARQRAAVQRPTTTTWSASGCSTTWASSALRAGFNRYNNVGGNGSTIVEDDVDYYSLGVIWQF